MTASVLSAEVGVQYVLTGQELELAEAKKELLPNSLEMGVTTKRTNVLFEEDSVTGGHEDRVTGPASTSGSVASSAAFNMRCCYDEVAPPPPALDSGFDRYELHVHESADSPPFNFRVFFYQLFVHMFWPWSLPLFFWVVKPGYRLRQAKAQIFLPPAGAHWFLVVVTTFISHVWPVVAQLGLVLAYFGLLAPYGRDEAIVTFVFFVAHRATVAAKYAGLSCSERERILRYAPIETSYSWMRKLQIGSGWTKQPAREGLVAEIELAAAYEGVDLASVWLGASKRADGYASTVASMYNAIEEGRVIQQHNRVVPTSTPSFSERLDQNAIHVLLSFVVPARTDTVSAMVYPMRLWKRHIPATIYRAERAHVCVSAGALATTIVYRAFAFTDRYMWITDYFGILFALVLAALPLVVRSAFGESPLGSTPIQIVMTVFMFIFRGFGYVTISTFLFASVWDYMRRAWMMKTLGCLVRAPMRDAHHLNSVNMEMEGKLRAAKRKLERTRTFVSHDREGLKDVPLLDMHCRETIKGWLQVRLVITSFAERYRIRIQMYFTVLLLMVAADIIWQLSSHVRELRAMSAEHERLGLGAYVCILFSVPAVAALGLQLAAGAYVNEQHTVHRDYLLTHRLLLREWATDLGSTRAVDGKRWAIDEDSDDMLRTTAEFVAASPPLRVFGFEASSALLKGFMSLIVSAVVLVAGLMSGNGNGSATGY